MKGNFKFLAIRLWLSCCCNKPPTPDFTEQEKRWLPDHTYIVTIASEDGDTISGVVNHPPIYSEIAEKCKQKDKRAVVQTNAVIKHRPLPYEFIRMEKFKDSVQVEYGQIFRLNKASFIGTFTISGKVINDVYYCYPSYVSQKQGLLQYTSLNSNKIYLLINFSKDISVDVSLNEKLTGKYYIQYKADVTFSPNNQKLTRPFIIVEGIDFVGAQDFSVNCTQRRN